jgi:hypothetical protein
MVTKARCISKNSPLINRLDFPCVGMLSPSSTFVATVVYESQPHKVVPSAWSNLNSTWNLTDCYFILDTLLVNHKIMCLGGQGP